MVNVLNLTDTQVYWMLLEALREGQEWGQVHLHSLSHPVSVLYRCEQAGKLYEKLLQMLDKESDENAYVVGRIA